MRLSGRLAEEIKDIILTLSVPARGGSPAAALEVWDILQKRNRESTRLTTRALTILPPPEALLWLSGDLRDAAPHAGIVLPEIEPAAEAADSDVVGTLPFADRQGEWSYMVQQSTMSDVRRLISEHVELNPATSLMRFDDLKEFGLIGDQFLSLFSKTDAAVQGPPDGENSDSKSGEEFSARM